MSEFLNPKPTALQAMTALTYTYYTCLDPTLTLKPVLEKECNFFGLAITGSGFV